MFTTSNLLDAIYCSPSVKHLVYLSALGDYLSDVPAALRACKFPHILCKVVIEQSLAANAAKLPFTVIGPGGFWANDFMALDSMVKQGVYPVSIGQVGMSRVSEKDIGSAICNAVLDGPKGKFAGKKIMVGSRKGYTDADFQALWGRALGKEIRLMKEGPEGLGLIETMVRSMRGPAWGRAFSLMVESFVNNGFKMTEEQYKLQVELLGREPLKYEDFVAETAKKALAGKN